MLNKVKVFSKIAQISSRNAVLPLNNSSRYFFAASSASNYDAGLESQTGSKSTVFAHPSTRGVSLFFFLERLTVTDPGTN